MRLRSYTTVSDRLFEESNKPKADLIRDVASYYKSSIKRVTIMNVCSWRFFFELFSS